MTVDKNTKNLEGCAECACFNLRKASRAITQLFDRALQPGGLRGTQFSVLAVLSFMGTTTVTRLSNNLVMDRTTLTRNLRPLEQKGYIRISAGKDLRTRTVELTDKGMKALGKVYPLWKETQTKIIHKLGKNRFQSLISDLSKISSLYSGKDFD
jgi:DNA-binding MarR family transcriptional regulator